MSAIPTPGPITCAAARKGFDLPCPRCGAAGDECVITLRLDMAEGEELRCDQCEAEFAVAEVRQLVERWGALLRWLDTMPACRTPAAD